MDRTALINQVKSKIDELSVADAVLVDIGLGDDKPIDTIIDDLLDESAKEVLIKAPIHRLNVSVASLTATQDPTYTYTGTIPLPSDYLRLISFKMAEWKRVVTELQTEGSDIALRQSNKWLRAKINKPVAVLSYAQTTSGTPPVTTGIKVIKYYSVVSSHTISLFAYVKSDVAENIPVLLQDALCWICASKVLAIFGNATGAKTAIENAVDLLRY